jgi:predicted dehydrogenase
LIRIGLLGYGYWGPKLARNIQASGSCELAAISDCLPERLAEAGRQHGGIRINNRPEDVISDPSIDAVAIGTPPDSHFALAAATLAAGKHVFLEKPMTQTTVEALRLIEESERMRLVLMVDHTYLFEPAVQEVSRIVCSGELGRLTLWESERTNRGALRSDANVLWDLAAHDLAILDYVLRVSPEAVNAVGTAFDDDTLEHAACLRLQFRGSFRVRVHVNWIAPRKVRRISIQGEAGVLVYDDLNPVCKVTVTPSADPALVRGFETEAAEPLQGAIQHFTRCIAGGSRPIADGAAGLRVVRLLEAADRSLKLHGRTVELDQPGEKA